MPLVILVAVYYFSYKMTNMFIWSFYSGFMAFAFSHSMLVLFGFMAAFVLGTLGYFTAMHKKKFATLAN
ncbi:hypothetical protein [Bacillus sp. FJAT-27445]|uniref:hypothetical protein n=1 Tax=Bacillus sp. FJAT-27445 TaxID=1679166 RepID=UPI0012E3D37F|nr:hypothetical protein [Bacillus sp. FJAT-27445]